MQCRGQFLIKLVFVPFLLFWSSSWTHNYDDRAWLSWSINLSTSTIHYPCWIIVNSAQASLILINLNRSVSEVSRREQISPGSWPIRRQYLGHVITLSQSEARVQPVSARYLRLPIWSKDGLKMHNNPGDLSKFSETAHHKPDGFRPNFFTLPVSLAIVLRQTRLLTLCLKQKVKDNKSFKREFET